VSPRLDYDAPVVGNVWNPSVTTPPRRIRLTFDFEIVIHRIDNLIPQELLVTAMTGNGFAHHRKGIVPGPRQSAPLSRKPRASGSKSIEWLHDGSPQ
jgi:hypothetical protein